MEWINLGKCNQLKVFPNLVYIGRKSIKTFDLFKINLEK